MIIGSLNSRFSAMAAPRTSARSQAAIASSARTHNERMTGREYESRQACARSRPAAMPSRAAIACSRMAMRFEIITTLSSV